MKRSFKSCVRITAIVLIAVAKFKKLCFKKQIERQEKPASVLKTLDFSEPKFSIFSCQTLQPASGSTEQQIPNYEEKSLSECFSVEGIVVKKYSLYQFGKWIPQQWSSERARMLRLTDRELSAALEYLFKKASLELLEFNDRKTS